MHREQNFNVLWRTGTNDFNLKPTNTYAVAHICDQGGVGVKKNP